MIELADTTAEAALIAGFDALAAAVQRFGELDGQRLFAGAVRTGKKIGVVKMAACQGTLKNAFRPFLADDAVKAHPSHSSGLRLVVFFQI